MRIRLSIIAGSAATSSARGATTPGPERPRPQFGAGNHRAPTGNNHRSVRWFSARRAWAKLRLTDAMSANRWASGSGIPELVMGRVALLIVVILVAAGTAACGGGNESLDVPPEVAVASAVEEFTEAINTYDAEALLSVTTDDFTWESTGAVQSRAEFVEYFEANYQAGGFQVLATGDLAVEREGDAYVAEEPGRVTSTDYNQDGRSVYRVVHVGDSWLVQGFRWYEDVAEG